MNVIEKAKRKESDKWKIVRNISTEPSGCNTKIFEFSNDVFELF